MLAALGNLLVSPVASDGNNPASRSSRHKPQLLETMMQNVPKLKELNYTQWKNTITNSIQKAKLWGYIDGSLEEPSGHDTASLVAYYEEAAAVRNAILGSLESTAQKYIEDELDPKDAWLALEKKYLTAEAGVDSKLVLIEQQLANLRLSEEGDMVEHIAEFCRMRCWLNGTRLAYDDQACISLLYRSLPPSYRQRVLTPEGAEMKDFSTLCARLTYLSQNPEPEAPAGEAPASTKDYTTWEIPEDIKEFKWEELWDAESNDVLIGVDSGGGPSAERTSLPNLSSKCLTYEFPKPSDVKKLELKSILRQKLRRYSDSAATHSRPTKFSMRPSPLRNSTLAQPDDELHFSHIIASPFSAFDPFDPAPIADRLRRSPTPSDDKPLSAGEDVSIREHSSKASADLAPPTRSRLNPPKQSPSTWQIFFTEFLASLKSTDPERKLNVSQAAKDGGAAYKALSSEQKEMYRRKARLAKAAYERELADWQRTLTPEELHQDNIFRSSQRKAGKSRRSNLKDPNAPKKPLSAYFMYLQWIRADPARIRDIFGDETETTRQSVLAASKWRELNDDEKKPFLAQAEREKLEYEAARKEYEERTSGVSKSNSYTGGYMRMTGETASNNSWYHTFADDEPQSPREYSPLCQLVGGVSFGGIMSTPDFTYDEEAAIDGDMESTTSAIRW